jgi:peptide/nickel transport system ATP-binding protein
MTVAEVQDFTAAVGERRIVDGVSFDLRAGEVTALVGASGSGKSTTGLALLGEIAPGVRVSGRIVVDGRDMLAGTGSGGLAGYVPQHPSEALNPARRIGGVLREIALRHQRERSGGRRARRARAMAAVHDTLRRVRLDAEVGILRRYPHQLSGGQQQRLVLAHALLCGAAVVVADEPTTGQDPVTRAGIADELRRLAGTGVALLVLTHDLGLVRELADRVLVLRGGRVVERGPVNEVLGMPTHHYTQALIAAQHSSGPGGGASPSASDNLAVRGLVAAHGRVTTLHAVDLSVAEGERIAVLGRSGSGKTTLARCVAGLLAPRAGEVLLHGRALAPDVRRRTAGDRAAVQYVFQDARASFSEFHPVGRQIARTAQLLRGAGAGEARDLAERALAGMGLPAGAASRLPGALSGGELQRAALARALLAEPEVLVCDEITSGLDTITRAGILDLLTGLDGRTLLVITHDLDVAARVADRVIVLESGRIVADGPPEPVLRDVEEGLRMAAGTAHSQLVDR